MFLRFPRMCRIALRALLLQLKQVLQATSLSIAHPIEIVDMHKINQHPRHIAHDLHVGHAYLLKTRLRHGVKKAPQRMAFGNGCGALRLSLHNVQS